MLSRSVYSTFPRWTRSTSLRLTAGLLALVMLSLTQGHGSSAWTAPWPTSSRNDAASDAYKRHGFEAPLANGIPLRIMGLGASTVFGAESFDLTGWRRPLRERLTRTGNPVNMVGTQRTGQIVDNDVEAYPGVRLDEIYWHAQQAIPKYKPNIVILYAGSNDNFQNASLPTLFKRFYAVAESVFTASPRATIVMSTLMPTTETRKWGGQDRVGICNTQIRTVYQVLKREGRPVVLVEMGDADGVQVENLTWDHMHPTRAGYQIMSRKFFEAIVEADARGYLHAPEDMPGIVDDGDLAPGRANLAFQDVPHELTMKKEEEEKAEEEAVLAMIEELRVRPWDRKPAVAAPVLPLDERQPRQVAT